MQWDNIGLLLGAFVVKVMFVGGAAVMLAFLLVFLVHFFWQRGHIDGRGVGVDRVAVHVSFFFGSEEMCFCW